jgi:predicted permease
MGGVTEQVTVLVLMMAAGFIAAKAHVITREGRGVLTDLVLYVTSPLLVISSFQLEYSPKLLGDMGVVAAFAALSMAAFYGLGRAMWPRRDDGKRRVLWQATLFSNCGFMGYPVLFSLFGDAGVVYGSVYVLVFTVFTWTLGVYIYAGKSGTLRQILLQPGLIAVFIGIVFFVTGIRFSAISQSLSDAGPFSALLAFLLSGTDKLFSGIGSLTTPLAMMIVGALVAEGDIRHAFKEWTVFAAAAVRLLLLPALSLGALWLLWRAGLGLPGLASPVMLSCVLLTAMPVAANVAIFASLYGVEPQYAARTVLVSTLLSVATVPGWIFVLHYFIGI